MKDHAKHTRGSAPLSFPLAGRAAIGRHHNQPRAWPPLLLTIALVIVLCFAVRALLCAAYDYYHRPPIQAPTPAAIQAQPVIQFHTDPPNEPFREDPFRRGTLTI